MIDFRYHLVSLVAVFLALGVGLLLGSSVLGDVLPRDIERRLSDLQDRNDELEARVLDLVADLKQEDDFARSMADWIAGRELLGQRVVLFEFEGLDGDVTSDISDLVAEADGEVTTVVRFTRELALSDASSVAGLQAVLKSEPGTVDELITTVAKVLGSRSAAAAAPRGVEPLHDVATRAVERLLSELEDGGFVEVEGRDGGALVPQAARFVVVGGSEEKPAFDAGSFAADLAASLSERGGTVLVAETSDSSWGLLEPIRNSGRMRELVSTVDHADGTRGALTVVVALGDAINGPAGHFGVEQGSTLIFPEPTPR